MGRPCGGSRAIIGCHRYDRPDAHDDPLECEMESWPIGVFTSIDAGLGVHLDVAQELGIRTVQVHAPHAGTRNQAAADAILKRIAAANITVTCVFGGFEGESYADIATTARP